MRGDWRGRLGILAHYWLRHPRRLKAALRRFRRWINLQVGGGCEVQALVLSTGSLRAPRHVAAGTGGPLGDWLAPELWFSSGVSAWCKQGFPTGPIGSLGARCKRVAAYARSVDALVRAAQMALPPARLDHRPACAEFNGLLSCVVVVVVVVVVVCVPDQFRTSEVTLVKRFAFLYLYLDDGIDYMTDAMVAFHVALAQLANVLVGGA